MRQIENFGLIWIATAFWFEVLLACDSIEYASVVEIEPKTCNFWRYSGEVRSGTEAGDSKDAVSWGKDCADPEPDSYKRLKFSQGSGRKFSIDTSVIAEADPATISNAGSKVEIQMKGCDGQIESTAVEAIYRPEEGDISSVAYLEYSSKSASGSWNLTVNRFSLASFQFDFVSTTPDETFGDRLARATIGAAVGNDGVFSASLCQQTLEPYKWQLEFFTPNAEIRRAIVGITVAKAIRDDRRDGMSGEEIRSQCRESFLALSSGLPILSSVLGATVLLLLMRRRRRKATMPLDGLSANGELEQQTQTAILASLEEGRERTPGRRKSSDPGGGAGVGGGGRGGRGKAIAPWEASLAKGGEKQALGEGEGAAPMQAPASVQPPASAKKAAWERELEAHAPSLSSAAAIPLSTVPPPDPAPPASAAAGAHAPSRFRAQRGATPSHWHAASPPRNHANNAGWRPVGSPAASRPAAA